MCDIVPKVIGRVYVSVSRCIYQNLAYEEYLFRHHDVEKDGDVMLLWSNCPAVVIGRYQNPWIEVNLPFIREYGIDLARRHSGGGAVYHDQGNMNISLLTTHKSHCRASNLKFLSKAINLRYKVNMVPNHRDDMELQPGSRKCSGTAARIANGRAYHHLTLMVDTDLDILRMSLKSPIKDNIQSNASRSISAKAVGYLKQDDVSASIEDVKSILSEEFKKQFEDCTTYFVDPESDMKSNQHIFKNYILLKDWQWIFGKTPKFIFEKDDRRQYIESGIIKECSIGRTGSRFEM